MSPRCRPLASVAVVSALALAPTLTAHAQPGLHAPGLAPHPAPPVVPVEEPTPTRGWIRVELGSVKESSTIGPMTGTDWSGLPSGTLPTGGALAARGLNARMTFGHGIGYGGVEFTVSWLDRAPLLVRPAGAGEIGPIDDPTDPEDEPIPNSMIGMRGVGGTEARFGPLFVGGELALGIGSVTIGGERQGQPWIIDPRLVLDLRGRAGVLVGDNLTVSIMASTSLVREDERSLGVLVGFAFGD